ncbi:MAG: tetratricopeptide repeat protein [Planctomycetes bacterium]|nr:tetratricopeptide repeat protein [Planctomycetota bacterium]
MATERLIHVAGDKDRDRQIVRLSKLLDRALDNPHGSPRPIGPSGLLEQLGSLLWDAAGLQATEIRQWLGDAADRDEALRLVVTDEDRLHLPWELLYHQHPDLGFLGRHPRCVIVRRVAGSGQQTPMCVPGPLRLLLFVASPEDLDAERSRLDYEREEELLFTALDRPAAAGQVDIDVAEDGCLPTLLSRLKENQYHAVILSMHGTNAVNRAGKPEWGLLLEHSETGKGDPIAGSELAARFEELPPGRRPALVMLAACRSARLEETEDSITSVAVALHRSGIERVLGMRLSVLDAAAAAFNARFFKLLAGGHSLGRAVSLTRRQLAAGEWLSSEAGQTGEGKGPTVGDPFAQWTLPVLLDRTCDGPLLDLERTEPIHRKVELPSVIAGDGTLHVPARSAFVGRRTQIRQHLRPFLAGDTPRLLLTGPGGVGKTTLAGLFARILRERQPQTRLLGLRAPMDLETLYEPLRQQAFDGGEQPDLIANLQTETDLRRRIAHLLRSLATRAERPCAFLLDNLEVLQDLRTLQIDEQHADSLWLVEQVCSLPAPTRVLLTGRYRLPPLDDLVTTCAIPDAPYGDVLRRMARLGWPGDWDAAQKRQLYKTLGGNHRALEWLAHILQHRRPEEAQQLLAALDRLEAPPDTPAEAVAVVLEAMRQNLLLDQLMQWLTAGQRALLTSASLYRVAVSEDGLLAVDDDADHAAENREGLIERSLLEWAFDPELEMTYYEVPPVVRQLLDDIEDRSAESTRELHARIARYHEFQGRFVTRRWTDDVEAVHHYRAADLHVEADRLAEPLANFYYQTADFEAAAELARPIIRRRAPPPPWWSLSCFGMCQHVLGDLTGALDAHERALAVVPDKRTEGTTLNNISQIHKARGDYDAALGYLEQSLKIQRDIGDKAGEGNTLNNLATTAHARGDNEAALGYLEQSLKIRRDIGDKAGLISTLHNMAAIALEKKDMENALTYWVEALQLARETGNAEGIFNVAAAMGGLLVESDRDQAIELLSLAVDTGRAAGFPQTDKYEEMLRSLKARNRKYGWLLAGAILFIVGLAAAGIFFTL